MLNALTSLAVYPWLTNGERPRPKCKAALSITSVPEEYVKGSLGPPIRNSNKDNSNEQTSS